MESSGSSRRNKSLSRALASPKDAPQKLDTGLHQIKQMNIEDGLVCAQRLEQRSSGCSRCVWRYVCKREDMLPGGASYFTLSRRGPEVSRKSSGLGIIVLGTGDHKSRHMVETKTPVTPVITSRSSRNSYHEMAQVQNQP